MKTGPALVLAGGLLYLLSRPSDAAGPVLTPAARETLRTLTPAQRDAVRTARETAGGPREALDLARTILGALGLGVTVLRTLDQVAASGSRPMAEEALNLLDPDPDVTAERLVIPDDLITPAVPDPGPGFFTDPIEEWRTPVPDSGSGFTDPIEEWEAAVPPAVPDPGSGFFIDPIEEWGVITPVVPEPGSGFFIDPIEEWDTGSLPFARDGFEDDLALTDPIVAPDTDPIMVPATLDDATGPSIPVGAISGGLAVAGGLLTLTGGAFRIDSANEAGGALAVARGTTQVYSGASALVPEGLPGASAAPWISAAISTAVIAMSDLSDFNKAVSIGMTLTGAAVSWGATSTLMAMGAASGVALPVGIIVGGVVSAIMTLFDEPSHAEREALDVSTRGRWLAYYVMSDVQAADTPGRLWTLLHDANANPDIGHPEVTVVDPDGSQAVDLRNTTYSAVINRLQHGALLVGRANFGVDESYLLKLGEYFARGIMRQLIWLYRAQQGDPATRTLLARNRDLADARQRFVDAIVTGAGGSARGTSYDRLKQAYSSFTSIVGRLMGGEDPDMLAQELATTQSAYDRLVSFGFTVQPPVTITPDIIVSAVVASALPPATFILTSGDVIPPALPASVFVPDTESGAGVRPSNYRWTPDEFGGGEWVAWDEGLATGSA